MAVATNSKKLALHEMTATQIRRCVFLNAIGLWGLYTVAGQWRGLTFPRAIEIGFWSALSGVVVWAIYHVVSRRNNGGIIPVLMNPFLDRLYEDSDYRLGIALKTLILSVLFFGIGFACRKSQRSTARGDASAVDGTREIPKRSA